MTQEEKKVYLSELVKTPGWKIIEEELGKNLEWLTDCILDSEDESMTKTSPNSKRELFIKWHRYNKWLKDIPQEMMKALESNESLEFPNEFDPYYREEELDKLK